MNTQNLIQYPIYIYLVYIFTVFKEIILLASKKGKKRRKKNRDKRDYVIRNINIR